MLPGTRLAEERAEGVVPASAAANGDGPVSRHVAVRLNAMLQAVELPACIANLNSGLSYVYGDALTLDDPTHTHKKRKMFFSGLAKVMQTY